MWNLLGDAMHGPSGTYYYGSGGHRALFWHMFDQVLIRPELMTYFANEDLKILDSDGMVSLLNDQGQPDRDNASDHLPLLIRLSL